MAGEGNAPFPGCHRETTPRCVETDLEDGDPPSDTEEGNPYETEVEEKGWKKLYIYQERERVHASPWACPASMGKPRLQNRGGNDG